MRGAPRTTVHWNVASRARLWVDEDAGATFAASGRLARSVVAGAQRPGVTRVTVEALIPRGGHISYGLLGVCFEPVDGAQDVRLEVPWSAPGGAVWAESLSVLYPSPLGLSEAFAPPVLAELAAAAQGRVAPGVLRVTEAAECDVGSSPKYMSGLARVCLELLLSGPRSDEEFIALLRQSLNWSPLAGAPGSGPV